MRIANFWTEAGDNPIFNLKRTERKDKLRDIVLEAMRTLTTKPLTKLELQKLVHIRRRTFLRLLSGLVSAGAVVRMGDGTKGAPYKYVLAELHRDNRS